MMRVIIDLVVVLMLVSSISGCSSSRKSSTELKGLMLLESSQLGRNRSYYSRREARKIVDKHQKLHRIMKKKAFGRRRPG